LILKSYDLILYLKSICFIFALTLLSDQNFSLNSKKKKSSKRLNEISREETLSREKSDSGKT